MMPIRISFTLSSLPAASAIIAAAAQLPCVTAFSARSLPRSPSPDDRHSRPRVSNEMRAARSRNRALRAQLREARAEVQSLRQRLVASDDVAEAKLRSAVAAKDLELRGTRNALQGLREAHVELIRVMMDYGSKRGPIAS